MTRVLIIGGSSGIGLALAGICHAEAWYVTIAGRSPDRLAAAARRLPGIRTRELDVARENEVRQLFADTEPVDHVVVTAVDAAGTTGPLAGLGLDRARALVDTKVLGSWMVARYAAGRLAPGGTMTFTSGVNAYRPVPGASMAAAVNGAVEAMVRALALELAPVRVNAVCPGWTDTPMWDAVAGSERAQRLAAMARRLPLGRVGRPEDAAKAIRAVIDNGFVTGTTIHVDGGQRLV